MLHAELQEEEEFQEADILWPDAAQDLKLPHTYYSHVDGGGGDNECSCDSENRLAKQQHHQQKASSPIDIPRRKIRTATGARGTNATAGFSKFVGANLAGAVGGGSVVAGSHVFVPPHVIVDRRAKRVTALMMMMPAVPKGKARTTIMMLE